MNKRRVLVVVGVVIVAALLAATIAAAGGIVGYLVAKRSLAFRLPWGPYQRGRQRLPVPFLLPAPQIRREFVILAPGAQVTWVEKESPADEAGIEVGDIITAVDGQKIDEDHPLRDLILEHEPGDKITLTLTSRGESREIQVTLGETTDEEGKTIPYLGARYRSIKRRRFFQPQRFDLSHLEQPKLNLLIEIDLQDEAQSEVIRGLEEGDLVAIRSLSTCEQLRMSIGASQERR